MASANTSTYDGPARDIRIYPDPVLEQPSEPVRQLNDEIRKLAARMCEAMHAAKGIGLAACQLGVTLRLIVLSAGSEIPQDIALVNPEIIEKSGSSVAEEGCLSFPGVTGKVPRSEKIKVRYLSLDGTVTELSAEMLLARVIQHELDHLDGILFIDKMSPAERIVLQKKLREMKARKKK